MINEWDRHHPIDKLPYPAPIPDEYPPRSVGSILHWSHQWDQCRIIGIVFYFLRLFFPHRIEGFIEAREAWNPNGLLSSWLASAIMPIDGLPVLVVRRQRWPLARPHLRGKANTVQRLWKVCVYICLSPHVAIWSGSWNGDTRVNCPH